MFWISIRIVKRILDNAKTALDEKVSPIEASIASLNEEIKKIRENKDATDEEKKTAADKETEIENLRKTEHDAVKTYADATPLVRQLIDIALLSGNLLKGEELDKFLKRSVDLLQ